jgi:glycolate oxidase FAD binding subunit
VAELPVPVPVREARAQDAINQVRPRWVVEPGSTQETAEVLRAAHAAGLRTVVRGGGSKLGWGNPPAGVDLLLSTGRLGRVLEHAAGDLVTRVEAGVRLADLQAELAPAGQLLGLDPPEVGATIGGVVAANASGPRRLRYGTVRDLLIGITVVLADGTVAHSGGKVVKNVAGYDLGKLFAGSLGTLGVIVEAIFRLHPVPAATAVVTAEVAAAAQAGSAVRALLASALVPSAIELDWPDPDRPGTLTVLFEGIGPGVTAQAGDAARLLDDAGTPGARALDGDQAGQAAAGLGALPWQAGQLGVKAATGPRGLPGALGAVWEVAAATGLPARVTAHAGTGVLRAGLGPDHAGGVPAGDVEPAGGAAMAAFVTGMRERLGPGPATLVVVQAPPEVKRAVDAWGPVGDALPLMRRVKHQFDPSGLLSPGRFVGGI